MPRAFRNWLRKPNKSLEYLWDRVKFRFGQTQRIKVRDDWEVICHPAAREHFEVFQTDPSQAGELDSFILHCPVGIRLLDVGAHYGFFALAALRYGGSEAPGRLCGGIAQGGRCFVCHIETQQVF